MILQNQLLIVSRKGLALMFCSCSCKILKEMLSKINVEKKFHFILIMSTGVSEQSTLLHKWTKYVQFHTFFSK